MMQLYRSFRTADWSSDVTSGVGDESLQGSDSVLSLTAGGESTIITVIKKHFSSVGSPGTLFYQTFSLYSLASVKMLIRL